MSLAERVSRKTTPPPIENTQGQNTLREPHTLPDKVDDTGRYIGRRRAKRDGTPNPSEDILKKRKRRRRVTAAAGAFIVGLSALAGGIHLKNNLSESSSQSSNTSNQTLPDKPSPPEVTPPLDTEPPKLTRSVTVKPNDSEWNLSETSLIEATGNTPSMAAVNATTILNAGINIQNGLAVRPDKIEVGQNLVILDAEAVKLINESANDPSIRPELAAKLKQLNSHMGSIDQVAKNEQAVIQEIQKDLAEVLTPTPIYNSVASKLTISPLDESPFSFDSLWAAAAPPTDQSATSIQHVAVTEQSTSASDSDSSIPSREISRLRKTAEQVIFSRPPAATKQNQILAA